MREVSFAELDFYSPAHIVQAGKCGWYVSVPMLTHLSCAWLHTNNKFYDNTGYPEYVSKMINHVGYFNTDTEARNAFFFYQNNPYTTIDPNPLPTTSEPSPTEKPKPRYVADDFDAIRERLKEIRDSERRSKAA